MSLVADPKDLIKRFGKYTDPQSEIIVSLCEELIKTRTELGITKLELKSIQDDETGFSFITLKEFHDKFGRSNHVSQ